MWLAIALTVSSIPLILYLLGRREEGKVRRDWELLLTPEGDKVYRSIESRVQSEMRLADMTYDEAFRVRELGSIDEAKQILKESSMRWRVAFLAGTMALAPALASAQKPIMDTTPVVEEFAAFDARRCLPDPGLERHRAGQLVELQLFDRQRGLHCGAGA